MQKNVRASEPGRGAALAFFLLTDGTEHRVFRAAVLSIVLTLAVGPNASLLCRTWCGDQQAAAASGCHHEAPATSPSVAGEDCCDSAVLGIAALLLKDERLSVSSPDGGHAILVLRYQQLALSPTDARRGDEPGRAWSLERRPLPTVLRI